MLKERIVAAKDRGKELKKVRQLLVNQRINVQGTQVFRYKLGDEHEGESQICLQAFRNLFCVGKQMWKRLKSKGIMAAPGPVKHGNVGSRHRHLSSISFSVEPDVVAFINGVGVEYGESYATRFVRERTYVGLWNEEEGCVDLPSYFSKRKLYERYVFFLLLFKLLSYLSNISLLDFVLSAVIF
jgi:hypothetical protein